MGPMGLQIRSRCQQRISEALPVQLGRIDMQTVLFGRVVAAFMLTMFLPSVGGAETVKGQIVDQACYLKDKTNNVGKDHKMPADTKDCAVGCAKQGNPLALLTADGKLYQIAG